jgi:ribosome-binding factor A
MSSIRIKRMEKELKKLISSVVTYKLNDPHLEQITITAIQLTKDFSIAKIYFTDLSDFPKEKVINVLEKSSGFIKNEIAKAKMMRTIPELSFYYDEVQEKAGKLEEIFQKIHKEE